MTFEQRKHMDSLRDQLDTPMPGVDDLERRYRESSVQCDLCLNSVKENPFELCGHGGAA